MDSEIDTQTARPTATPSRPELIAIVDIGKTNTKLVLLESGTGRIAWHAEHSIRSIPGALVRELNIAGIEQWLVSTLARAPHKECIRTLVPIAHGAAAVVLDAQRDAIAAPDYEDTLFDSVADEYRKRRDEFSKTFSPW